MESQLRSACQLGFLVDLLGDEELTDKFGGLPVMLDESDILEVPKCDSCSQPLYLVLQIIAPLEKLNLIDRILYLFSCNNSECPKHTWTLLRRQLPPPSSPPPPSPSPDLPNPTATGTWSSLVSNIDDNKEDDWGNDNDDTWGVGTAGSEDLESLLKIRDVTISQNPIPKSEPKKEQKVSPSVKTVSMASFSPVYIEWSPEPPEKSEKLNIPQEWVEDSTSEWQGEEYEEDVDKIWKKFKKTIAREPEQCLRYGNTPLTQKKLDIQVPKCEHCSSARTFEFQILPTVFDILEDMQIKNALDFANVLCYTCEASCQQVDKNVK